MNSTYNTDTDRICSLKCCVCACVYIYVYIYKSRMCCVCIPEISLAGDVNVSVFDVLL